MARKPQHFTELTSDESDARFVEAITLLGHRMANPERDARIAAIRVDGVPLGARYGELRKPGSVFYSASFLEARAVAAMLVDLGLDSERPEIQRADAPDAHVFFPNGRRVFVEQAMVIDEEAMRFSAAVDDANLLAEQYASCDEHAKSLFQRGSYIVRLEALSDEGLRMAFTPEQLATEVVALARTIHGPAWIARTDSEVYPILSALGAKIYYKPCNAMTARPIASPVFHGRRETLEPTLRVTLQKKIAKPQKFAAECRPLWLLLDVDLHFDAAAYLHKVASEVMDGTPVAPYDRVIIQTPQRPPLLFE